MGLRPLYLYFPDMPRIIQFYLKADTYVYKYMDGQTN